MRLVLAVKAGCGCPRCSGVGARSGYGPRLAPLLVWASAWLSRPLPSLITRPYHVAGTRLILTGGPRADPTGYEPNELPLTGWLRTSKPRVPSGRQCHAHTLHVLFTVARCFIPRFSPSCLSGLFLILPSSQCFTHVFIHIALKFLRGHNLNLLY